MTDWTIRPERPGDEDRIHAVVAEAFDGMPFADGTEPDLVDRLRGNGELLLSLVAETDTIIGHIGFNPISIDGKDCGWVQLSPVSVVPSRQRSGIGSALIKAGIAEMRRRGVRGIGVEGDPAYYERFGFTVIEGLGIAGPHAEYFRALVLSGDAPIGEVRYASAFY
ncbi:MAG: N-acetyltransferase [Novosphingobium sp.]|nr:N-acetyltransferase [Novosphingobium sp.]MCP5401449.1 N-acetyltransferase [Novosphingobium sp.]